MVRSGIQIGKVSERTGLSIDAIRFYEKQRLLERPVELAHRVQLATPPISQIRQKCRKDIVR
jgi:MerR family regulatory protein